MECQLGLVGRLGNVNAERIARCADLFERLAVDGLISVRRREYDEQAKPSWQRLELWRQGNAVAGR